MGWPPWLDFGGLDVAKQHGAVTHVPQTNAVDVRLSPAR